MADGDGDSQSPISQFARASEGVVTLVDAFARLKQWWEENRETISQVLVWAGVSYKSAEKLEHSGWLPHYTTPDLPFDLEGDEVDAFVARHYIERWVDTEAAFVERLDDYDVDDEAKACFKEALKAHGLGLYRVAPRLLFPELERLFRDELGDTFKVSASLGELRRAANDLGSDTFIRTGVLTFRLYRVFAERMYARTETDEEIARAAVDPIPNRHAAIHGRVIYNSQKSSLNVLVIAEFVLLTVGAVRASIETNRSGLAATVDTGQESVGGFAFPHIAGAKNWKRTAELALRRREVSTVDPAEDNDGGADIIS